MKTLQEMREAVNNRTAKVLTLEIAKNLIGKKINTIYFGYRGQDGVDEFVVGNVISEMDYYRNLKEDCYIDHPKGFKNRAEYWESYMPANVLSEYNNTMLLVTDDGRHTAIRAHKENDGVFTCSDVDRFVYFIEVSDEN
jgi:hypothetical protein